MCVTLLTDFGLAGEYAGVMKGVILTIAPDAVIVDISHGIGPQNVVQAAHMIRASYGWFPEGTIHTIVVDPGVGTGRNIIAAVCGGHIFLAPDNGVLTLILDEIPFERAFLVKNRRYALKPVSRTFHGRDIFAPAAAHLSNGVNIEDFGPSVGRSDIRRIDMELPVLDSNGELAGKVISVDRFGNLITSIPEGMVKRCFGEEAGKTVGVRIGGGTIQGFSESYEDVDEGAPLALAGSRGNIEISVNMGDARKFFNIEEGEPVYIFQAASVSCDDEIY